MDFATLFALLVSKYPQAVIALAALGTLVVIGQAVVLLTPSKKDDEYEASIFNRPVIGGFLKALIAFAPIQKK